MTLLANDWPRAMKNHHCDVCHGIIAAGDTYNRQRLIWDGEPATYKSHRLCDAIYWKAHKDAALFTDECPDDGELHDLLRDATRVLAMGYS